MTTVSVNTGGRATGLEKRFSTKKAKKRFFWVLIYTEFVSSFPRREKVSERQPVGQAWALESDLSPPHLWDGPCPTLPVASWRSQMTSGGDLKRTH